jgi:hypothetical protein
MEAIRHISDEHFLTWEHHRKDIGRNPDRMKSSHTQGRDPHPKHPIREMTLLEGLYLFNGSQIPIFNG